MEQAMMTQSVLNFHNTDLESIITPVNVQALDDLLTKYQFDPERKSKLVNGFRSGFELGYRGSRSIKKTAPNLKFTIDTPVDLWNKVMKEVEKGRYAGPFAEIPFEFYIQSPIGLVPKDNGKDMRLIFHLSYPKTGKSVNSETDPDLCVVKYPDFDEAVRLCMKECQKNLRKFGTSTAFQGKSDMKSAFRNLPLLVREFMLTLMKAVSPIDGKTYYFVDKCLPFGVSISCALFQEFSNCVAFIFKRMVNYMDDYYFVALLKTLCDSQITEFLQICEIINFPISLEKMFWGSTIIVFLGFLKDVEKQVIAIPVDKVTRAIDLVISILHWKSKKCTVHEIQKLCGFLNHLCKCMVPGRAFTRRFYVYTAGNLLPHHHINVNREMKSDLNMWLSFLKDPSVYSRPFADFSLTKTAEDLFWYTNASKIPRLGFGGIFNKNWFCQRWQDNDDQGNFIIDENP